MTDVSPWDELEGTTGKLLIAAFRWWPASGWAEYGSNDVGVSFGADQYDGTVGFISIPDRDDALPRDIIEQLANESALGLEALAELLTTYKASHPSHPDQ